LDGKTTSDYVARVEPSCNGGRKIAQYLLDVIENSGESNSCSNLVLSPTICTQTPKKDIMERKHSTDEA